MMTPEASAADVRTDALRLLSNGVYILTACSLDAVHAATVSWASQVSFQPPLVLIALRRNSNLAHAVRKAHRYALNILAADQHAVAEKFFTHQTAGLDAQGLVGQTFRMSPGRCPLLTECLAWLECRLAAELTSPGDHSLFLGEVIGTGVRRPGAPMILGSTPWSYGGLRDV